MNYKTRLQANNTEVQNNNVDLQAILNTINSLPTATEAINLDAEITEQEEISISQDTIIDQIQAALEGKAGNNLDTSDATATAEDIAKDKTAYVNGEKITGIHECASGEGGDGDATINTCTINFYNDMSTHGSNNTGIKYMVTTYHDAEMHIATTELLSQTNSQKVANVVCGSLAIVIPSNISFTGSNYYLYVNDNQLEKMTSSEYYCFTIPNEGNAEIDISIGL